MNTEALVQKAMESISAGDKAGAQDILAQALKFEPKNPRLWLLLSQVVGFKERAIFCLEKALEYDPGNRGAIDHLTLLRTRVPPLESNEPKKPKYCWSCGAQVMINTPHCGYCGVRLDQSVLPYLQPSAQAPGHQLEQRVSQLRQPTPQIPARQQVAARKIPANRKKRTLFGTCIGVIAVFTAVLLVIATLTNPSNDSSQNVTTNTPKPSTYEAYFRCKSAVEKMLKAPKTADFASFIESEVGQVADDEFVVSSYVDSENSFGAMIRTDYLCTIRFHVEDDTWSILGIETDP